MPQDGLHDVFTADEIARAARVSPRAVQVLVASGELTPIAGTRFFAASDAVRAGRQLTGVSARRRVSELALVRPPSSSLASTPTDRPALFAPTRSAFASRPPALPAFASSLVHGVFLLIVFLLTSGALQSAPAGETREEPRLVFLMTPGPGGGGGGGGLRNPLPAPRLERRGVQRARIPVPKVTKERVLTTAKKEEPPKPAPEVVQPKPVERAPEPLAARVLVAPVVSMASNTRDREGEIEKPRGTTDSQGSGVGGGAGTGQGTGNGQGAGSGLGEGSGGGTGGGPFRPGSGIEPPRLLQEIKAEYTEEARRRGITGDVVLEIVVKRDGTVGEITVLRGLGAGLESRAVAAVRQWRFAPARRRGEAVDVIVEVAVEFTLR